MRSSFLYEHSYNKHNQFTLPTQGVPYNDTAMSSTALRQEDLKVLDQTRQRLFQLANNIASLKADVQQGNPLPPWYILPRFILLPFYDL